MTLYGVELVVADDPEQVASIVADELNEAARAGRAMALDRWQIARAGLPTRGRARAQLEQGVTLVGR